MGKQKLIYKYAIFLLWLGLTTSLLGETQLIEINRVVAKVNDRIITWGEIERKMDQLNFSNQEKKKRAVEFVDGEIDKFLSLEAFDEQGMAIPDSYIEQEYNKKLLNNFNGDRKLFRDALQSNGQSQLEYREQIKENIIHMHMLAKRKRSREEISPEKVELFYNQNHEKFKLERQIRLSEIVFSPNKDFPDSRSLAQHAKAIRKSMQSPNDFYEIAKTTGTSHFKDKGGDWGVMVKASELKNSVIRDKAFALKVGEISEPFSLSAQDRIDDNNFEIYILMVTEEKPERLQPVDEVRFEIEKILASQIESEEQSKWLNKRKRDAYVIIDLPED